MVMGIVYLFFDGVGDEVIDTKTEASSFSGKENYQADEDKQDSNLDREALKSEAGQHHQLAKKKKKQQSGKEQLHLAETIDINQATVEELMSLPGIGRVKAERIIRYRQEEGSFKEKAAVMKVKGIKEATYRKIETRIKVK